MNITNTKTLALQLRRIAFCECFWEATLAWQGKVRDQTRASQPAREIHFRCAVIAQLEHNYSGPRFKNILNNS